MSEVKAQLGAQDLKLEDLALDCGGIDTVCFAQQQQKHLPCEIAALCEGILGLVAEVD